MSKFRFPQRFVLTFLLVCVFAAPAHATLLDRCHQYLGPAYWRRHMLDNPPTTEGRRGVEWIREAKELDPVVETLARAFHDDPLLNWFTPNKNLQKGLIGTFANHAFISGGVLQIKGGDVGAALWMENHRTPTGPLSIVLSGQWALVPRFGWHVPAMLTFDNHARKMRAMLKRTAPGTKPPLHLWFIGVAPEHQGHGYASELIRPVLDIADRENRAVILELQKPDNQLVYERYGFGCACPWQVPSSVPRTTTMIRHPRRIGDAAEVPPAVCP